MTISRDFKCWIPANGDTVSDAIDVCNCDDPEQAAQELFEYDPEAIDVDGDPVIVAVQGQDGNVTYWQVYAHSDVWYDAEQVDGAEPKP